MCHVSCSSGSFSPRTDRANIAVSRVCSENIASYKTEPSAWAWQTLPEDHTPSIVGFRIKLQTGGRREKALLRGAFKLHFPCYASRLSSLTLPARTRTPTTHRSKRAAYPLDFGSYIAITFCLYKNVEGPLSFCFCFCFLYCEKNITLFHTPSHPPPLPPHRHLAPPSPVLGADEPRPSPSHQSSSTGGIIAP